MDFYNSVTPPSGKIVTKDRIADSMFQQVLLWPDKRVGDAEPERGLSLRRLRTGHTGTIRQKKMTCGLHRQMDGATLVKTSEFGREIVNNMAVRQSA